MSDASEFVTKSNDLFGIPDDRVDLLEAHEARLRESRYLIQEKHLTIGTQAWILGQDQRLLFFVKETGAMTRDFRFYLQEPDKQDDGLVLLSIRGGGKGFIRAVQGANFGVFDWQDRPLFSISRQILSFNRQWHIATPDDQRWGVAHESLATSVARRIPVVRDFTVLTMEIKQQDRLIATFARKRLSLGDVYELDIRDAEVDRRLLLALGVLFECIHD